jgi:hypothetical protein
MVYWKEVTKSLEKIEQKEVTNEQFFLYDEFDQIVLLQIYWWMRICDLLILPKCSMYLHIYSHIHDSKKEIEEENIYVIFYREENSLFINFAKVNSYWRGRQIFSCLPYLMFCNWDLTEKLFPNSDNNWI